ncbi:MAG: hypothetical protein IPJ19_21300 [Planctomycetes bacterium]|nr:hypothetical protein [Planctomycetota bacterium]
MCALACSCTKRVQGRWGDGELRFEGRVSRLDGEREDLWTWWFPNGERREQGRLEHGQRAGKWRQWYANGQRRSEGEREPSADGRASPREGFWQFWFENGEQSAKGVFIHGLREGHWDFYLTSGKLDGEHSGEYHLDQRIH